MHRNGKDSGLQEACRERAGAGGDAGMREGWACLDRGGKWVSLNAGDGYVRSGEVLACLNVGGDISNEGRV